MTTTEKIAEQKRILEEAQKRIEELEKEKGWPQKDDDYWYKTDDGLVFRNMYDGGKVDLFRQSLGNMYPTKEACEADPWIARRQAEVRILKYIEEYGIETVEGGYMIYIDIDGELDTFESSRIYNSLPKINSIDDSQKLLKACHDDLMIYLTGGK